MVNNFYMHLQLLYYHIFVTWYFLFTISVLQNIFFCKEFEIINNVFNKMVHMTYVPLLNGKIIIEVFNRPP
jgi:hypothetical protein